MYTVKSHTRRGRTRDQANDPTRFEDDPTANVQRLLGASDSEAVLSSSHRPVAVLMTLTRHLKRAHEAGELPTHIHTECERTLHELNKTLGGCERLLTTPLPLSYTRHTSRTLALWLLFLPLALWGSMGVSCVPATFFVTYLLLGIDEIGIQIEEPFCTLPLTAQCDALEAITNEIVHASAAASVLSSS